MLRVTVLKEGRAVSGGPELLDLPGPHWLDVQAPTPEEMEDLARRYGLHKLAVEDVLHLDQRPKVEEYPSHVFVVLQGFSCGKGPTDLELHELHFFLGQDWLITAHDLPSRAVEQVRRRVEDEPTRTLGRGCDFILYMVADALVDGDFPVLDALSDELEEIESCILENPEKKHLERMLRLKHALVQLRRVLGPQREALNTLTRQEMPQVSERTTLYFRDVYDHLVRLHERIDALRDMVGNAMDLYLSMLAQRTNDVTKRLTIFATIFLPLSFVTGFFGQNFEVLTHPVFFWVMAAVIIVFPLVLLVWFHREKWL